MKKINRRTQKETLDKLEEDLIQNIETITHSGLESLDPSLLKEIKETCRKSPKYVDTAYFCILRLLKTNHSEVRLAAFRLCSDLFQRSHHFRNQVINDLEIIFGLVGGSSLPPPKRYAEKLRKLAYLTIPKWKDKFGSTYKRMRIGYDYLARTMGVDFEKALQEEAAEECARAEKERRDKEIQEQILKELKENFEEKSQEIDLSVNAIENCVGLLLPTPTDFFIATSDDYLLPQASSNEDDPVETDQNLRLHGINSTSYNLVIDIKPNSKINIERNKENGEVIDNLKENLRLVRKRFLPLFTKWEVTLGNLSPELGSETRQRISEIKTRLENSLKKSKELRIDGGNDSSDEESDMEEVTKEGYEPAVLPICSEPFPHPYYSSGIAVPGPSGIARFCKSESSTTPPLKEPLEKKRPQMHLEEMSSEDLPSTSFVAVRMDKWGTGDMEMDEVALPDCLRTRVVHFQEDFEPVTRSCRAPLPSGKLCPRMDRFKCPFHGKIVPRDDTGKCTNPEDEIKPSEEVVPEWQDPALLARLKEVTGIDLKMPEKGVRKKRGRNKISKIAESLEQRKLPGVTDIGKLKNNSKLRLKKKLFSKWVFHGLLSVNLEFGISRSALRRLQKERRKD